MTRKGFRKLILLWWLSDILGLVMYLATKKYLPMELTNYLERMTNAEPTTGDWIVIAVGLVVLVATIVVSVGLYRFRPWAKRLFLPIQIVALIVMPFYGPFVMTGWAYALGCLYSVLTGGLLFLVYLSPVSKMFEAKGDAQETLAQFP